MDNNTKYVGISATSLLGVAFVILKLCHVINWSWWWVTCPFWGPVVIILAIALVCALVIMFASLFEKDE